jgi:predicted RNA-binding protein YlxR (DUF448 family)
MAKTKIGRSLWVAEDIQEEKREKKIKISRFYETAWL